MRKPLSVSSEPSADEGGSVTPKPRSDESGPVTPKPRSGEGGRRATVCGPGRPPWWPENEPWEPWRVAGRRGRIFRRRIALLALTVLVVLVGTMVAMVWLAVRNLAATGSSSIGAVITIVVLGAVPVALALVLAVRHVGLPFGTIMEGADRVAAGDYTTRVPEHGPPPMRALARAFNTMTERLQNHDRQRRDLMADVAHELRTPLTVIQGKLEGLLDGVYPPDERQLGVLVEETHVLSRLIEDLRTVALSEGGALKLLKESADVDALARDVVHAFEGEAFERGVTLRMAAPEHLPPIAVDPVRIREVLSNLLANALRHTPSGGTVDVRVYELRSNGSSDAITVDVRDTGSGMSTDEIARAFDRFHKGPGSRGSGLGLSIARGLVTAHGGEIRASSAPGAGTTMSFTLPRERAS
jgi:two-component system OmpR family sensor kinase/two-component system sensor histidine kinase BaeS